MPEQIDNETVRALIEALTAGNKAFIYRGNTEQPFAIQVLTLDLTTVRLSTDPLKLKFPFKTLYVQSATDGTVTVNVRPDTDASYQSAVPIKLNDVLKFDHPVSSVNIHWDAQSSKSITLIFFVDADFSSGSLISSLSGAIKVTEGNSFLMSVVNLAAATAGIVFAASATRIVSTLQNNTGAPIWVGPSTVAASGANLGYEVPAGGTFQWKNTAVLYAISTLGGDVHITEET